MKHTITLLATFLSVLAGGCCNKLIYKPTCDPAQILALKPPAEIRTLARYPHTETYIAEGINKMTGRRHPYPTKEMFEFRDEYASYRFILLYSEDAAKREYNLYKQFSRVPIFSETSKDGITFLLYYDEQLRADPEGGCIPLGTYDSSATILIRNLIVAVGTGCQTRPNNKLDKAIKRLAETLPRAWAETENSPGQVLPPSPAPATPAAGQEPHQP